jgi:hypothetical protein
VPSAVAELLADLAAALEAARARWYLFGAQAVILYGVPRLTADVDVTVELGARPTAALVAALEGRRFEPRGPDAEGFAERTRVLPLVHAPSRIPVDAVLAGPGIEEVFLDRAVVHQVEGVPVRCAAADDLVAMKILAGRPKDLDDVAAILAVQGPALDARRARETVRLLEQALDRADLLPTLDRLLARAGRPP